MNRVSDREQTIGAAVNTKETVDASTGTKVGRQWRSPLKSVADLSLDAQIMLIINCTPDSFSDGGTHQSLDAAVDCAQQSLTAGVQFFDVGGESTRPGSRSVSAQEELDRVIPVIEGLHARFEIPISIDSSKAVVADAALRAGAVIVNDVSAGSDPEMFTCVAGHQAMMVLMHMQGTPLNMQDAPAYDNIVDEICNFLHTRIQAAVQAGIARASLIIDPGVGFGKTLAHNTAILQQLNVFSERLDRPLLLGLSRKSFLPQLLGADMTIERGAEENDGQTEMEKHDLKMQQRDQWSHHVHALVAQSCSILRVHDARGARHALTLARALDHSPSFVHPPAFGNAQGQRQQQRAAYV